MYFSSFFSGSSGTASSDGRLIVLLPILTLLSVRNSAYLIDSFLSTKERASNNSKSILVKFSTIFYLL